ncbi:MAG TPA: sugar ABC transporter permease [Caldilineaceae bacterium]|nr:sugar ABC transporter permease [Caldilineaceae bacterium]
MAKSTAIQSGAISTPLRGWGVQVRRTLRKPQFWFGAFILVPLLAWYIIFGFWPIIRAFRMAVTDYQLLDPAASPFVGLKHFRMLFDYELFWISLKNTLLYAAAFYAIMLPLALLVAVALAAVKRGRNLYQALIFIPVVVSLVAISLLFKMLMDPQVGQLNAILRALGLPSSRFLSGPESALLSVVAVDVWKALGFYVIILTAGILNIPEEMYDAAKVDGAGAWPRFRHITIPLLAHTLALICVLIAMHGLQVFTQVVVMPPQAGGPGRATYVMNLLVYNEAFMNLRFGFATATSFVLFLFILVITFIQFRVIRPKWSY